jgi:ABC-type nitrate/sulfonate/bicarbonate transport system permease component
VSETREVRYRGGSFQLRERPWLPLAAAVSIVSAWELCSLAGLLPTLFMPAPHDVLRALLGLVQSGKLFQHLVASLVRIGFGWLLGTSAGLALGFAMGIFSVARALGMALTAALFPVPKIALLPLFILWFGIGEPSKLATIAFGVFFPTVVSTYAAVDHVPRNLIAMAQSFGVPARDIVWKVIVPGALPGVLAGFRISSSIALILVVAAEMIGAQVGIGAFVLLAGNLMQTDQLIAGVLVLSLLGLGVSWLISAAERSLLRWR